MQKELKITTDSSDDACTLQKKLSTTTSLAMPDLPVPPLLQGGDQAS